MEIRTHPFNESNKRKYWRYEATSRRHPMSRRAQRRCRTDSQKHIRRAKADGLNGAIDVGDVSAGDAAENV